MFQVLAHAQQLAAGSWTADHTTMLRDFSCTKERAKLGWCHIATGSDGTGLPSGTNMTM